MKTLLIISICWLLAVPIFAQNSPHGLPQGLMAEISINAGRGFEEIVLFKTTEGDDATISAGGGVGIQVGVAYFTPIKLQVAAHLGYGFSELSPVLNNVDVSFNRITFTPEVRYPITITPGNFITVGAGYGLYTSGKLQVDADELVGLKTDHLYAPATGVHLSLTYQIAMADKAALELGAKVYFLNYVAQQSYINGTEVTSFGPNLNGDGFELFIRFSYGAWLAPKGK